ncbi:MAG: DNA polymerase III subunit delta' [Syntrophaceae bacterium]
MSFKDIYGHEKQISVLKTALARDRIPHAYLFYGMDGIGKRTTAEVFAKALNCISGKDILDACDACPSCLKIDHRNHPDVITIQAEGQFIKVKEIREIQEQMKFRPFEGGKRIIIIRDADRMNIVSANALLKTLEEPSASNILILITSRPYMLPMTILSRCQHLRFNPLQKETVASFLQEKLALDNQSSYLIALSSGGSIGKAVELNDDSHLAMKEAVLDIMSQTRMKDPLRLLTIAGDLGQERKEIMDRLGILMSGYRDALVYKETGDIDRIINRDYVDIIKSIAECISGRDILNSIKAVDQALHALNQNANKQLTLEAMMFKLVKNYE